MRVEQQKQIKPANSKIHLHIKFIRTLTQTKQVNNRCGMQHEINVQKNAAEKHTHTQRQQPRSHSKNRADSGDHCTKNSEHRMWRYSERFLRCRYRARVFTRTTKC